MAPETAVTPPWRNVFTKPDFKKRLSMIAVDEAHCIFEWFASEHVIILQVIHIKFSSRGPEFRTCFREIGGLRALSDAPIIALTATAPHGIKTSICDSLGLSEPAVILQTLDRPNIYLSTCKSRGLRVSSSVHTYTCAYTMHMYIIICNSPNFQCDFEGLVTCMKSTDPHSIPKTLIFCQTKESAIKAYRLFLQYTPSKDTVSVFHASLTQSTKSIIVDNFQSCNSSLRILVATIAFGMVCVQVHPP